MALEQAAVKRTRPTPEAIERARADARQRRVEMGLPAKADPCSWCNGDGFIGVVPCRECESTGIQK